MERTEVSPEDVHPETLQEKPPEIILNLYQNVISLVSANGWYILFAVVVFALVWPKIRSILDQWEKEREQRLEDAKRHKNPELYETRQLAMEVARLRMQAEHDSRAQVAAEKAAEKEALKRQERAAKFGPQVGGNKLNSTTNQEAEPLERSQYNPLMGAGSSSGFRPSRRSCPGGGCG